MTSAAVYVRASTEHQNYSTDNQFGTIQKYATLHGMQIQQIYSDKGRSGLNLAGRPALRQLLRDVLAPDRAFDALIVYDISRWGRFQDPDESAHYEFVCRRAGVRVIYCAEPFENDGSPMANIMKAIKREMAGEYSRELSVKVALGKRRLAELGYRVGGSRGFGFERMLVDQDGRQKGLLSPRQIKNVQSDRVICVPGPAHERALVRRIFEMFTREDLGETRIAAILNAEEAPSATKIKWNRGAITQILKDERYIGTLVYGRTTTRLKTGHVNVPSDLWIRVCGAVEATVSKKSFAKAQAKIKARSAGWNDEHFLAGLRRLLAEKGTINQLLIKADDRIPGVMAYQRRFGNLYQAYQRVGFTPTRKIRGSPICRGAIDAEILKKIGALLESSGYLNRDLINATDGLPCATWITYRFGSLRAVYTLIGYQPQRAWRGHPRSSFAGAA